VKLHVVLLFEQIKKNEGRISARRYPRKTCSESARDYVKAYRKTFVFEQKNAQNFLYNSRRKMFRATSKVLKMSSCTVHMWGGGWRGCRGLLSLCELSVAVLLNKNFSKKLSSFDSSLTFA